MSMIDLYNEIKIKEEILYILREALNSKSTEQKIDLLKKVYSEKGVLEVLNHGINSRIEGVSNEIKELKKYEKKS